MSPEEITQLITAFGPLVTALAALVAAITGLFTLVQAKKTHKIVNSELANWKIAATQIARAEGVESGRLASEATERNRRAEGTTDRPNG